MQWVLICAPLAKTAIQLYPFILTLATFSTPCQCWKGSGFKKGVCLGGFMPWEPPSGGSLMCWLLLEGSGLPSLMLPPPCHITVCFPQSLYKQTIMDKMFQATIMITELLHLGILYSPCQAHHKLFSNPFYSAWIIALLVLSSPSILFLQMCQMHCWCFGGGLVALQCLQGEETGSLQFWSIVCSLGCRASGKLHRIFFLHLPGSP